MRIVERIFRMVGVEGYTMRGVKRAFEREGVPAPKGGKHWNLTFIHRTIVDDVYRPHTYEETKALLTPEVAGKLRPDERYGIWWYNRTRTLISYVCVRDRTERQAVQEALFLYRKAT